MVDFDDTFLTTVDVLVVLDAWALLLLLLLKLKEGGLGLVGEGVASSMGTEGGGTNSATCRGSGSVDGRGIGLGSGIITLDQPPQFHFICQTSCIALQQAEPLICSPILSLNG